jgi:hypothetical protein
MGMGYQYSYSITDSASSVTVIPAGGGCFGREVQNTSTGVLYLKFGPVASANNWDVTIEPGETYEFPPPVYSGVVSGIWSATSGGAAVVQAW